MNLKDFYPIAFFTISLLTPGSAVLAGSSVMNGYYKSFFIGYDAPFVEGTTTTQDNPVIGSVTNRVRVNASYELNEWLSGSLSYDIIPRIQDKSLFAAVPNSAGFDFPVYRIGDLERWLYPDDIEEARSFGISQNLDRIFLTFRAPFADVFIGRQVIAWGSSRVINPTDVLAPFSFDELDTEDRRGVDAIRVRVPVGFMSELDAGYVAGDKLAFNESAFYLRVKTYISRTDVSGLITAFRENLLVGIDVSRSIGGAGFWVESAHVFTDALGSARGSSSNDYFRTSIGIDYALTATLYGFCEYHYSQAGSANPEQYLSQMEKPAFTDGAVYLLGRHYLTPGVSYQITPLITGSAQALIALGDPSLFLAPRVEYNIAEDIYLSAGAFIGAGENPQNAASEGEEIPAIVFRSEFGGYADLYYTSFRVYF